MAGKRALLATVAFLFFVSGLTGLVYEVIWAKYFALLLGSTAHAQMGVLAVFMGGLALGAALWGSIADRVRRPLALYGVLEIAIGASAGAFTIGFDSLTRLYWEGMSAYGTTPFEARLLQTALCVLTMGPPTIFMGGTLPVLARAFGLTRAGFGKGVALLYGLNSAGAAAGAALAGFVLVPLWGLDRPFLAAAAVNIVLGGFVLWLDRRWDVRSSADEAASDGGPVSAAQALANYRAAGLVIPLVAGITGAVAMVYEVAWIRLCSLVVGSSTYAFSTMLTAFILGIAAGGLAFRLLHPARHEPVRFFVVAALASAAIVLACVPFYERLPYWFSRLLYELRSREGGFLAFQLTTLAFWVLVMLPLTFSNGLIFPALAHAAAQVQTGIAKPISSVLAANTLGTIAGTVGAALVLLPQLGLEGSFRLAAGLTCATALAVLAMDRRLSLRQLMVAATALAACFFAVLALSPRWDKRLLIAGEFRRHGGIPPEVSFAEYKRGFAGRLLYYRDGATGTVSVEDSGSEMILRVNGKTEASLVGDRETQFLVGHLPALFAPKAERALLIGFGSGMTAAAVARHPFQEIDVVEIAPEMLEAAAFYRDSIGDVLADRRLRVHIEDARTFLFRTPHRYDVIISEPSNPWVAGVSSLFTEEFFAQVRSRLAPGGVLMQWFHTYETADTVVQTLLRTALRSFPEVHVFQSNFGDLLLLASLQPLQVDPTVLAAAYRRAEADLRPLGLTRAESVLSLELAPGGRLRQAVGEGTVHRDRTPVLEYLAAQAFFYGAFAEMFQSLATHDADGYLLPAAQLPLPALADWYAYSERLDLLRQANSVRVLAAWFERAPRDPSLRAAAASFLRAEPRRLRFIHALRDSRCSTLQPAVECARGLLEILAAGPYPPNGRFIREIEASIRRAAAESSDFTLLLETARLYLAADEPQAALAVLNIVPARAGEAAEFAGRAACLRGFALERVGDRSAAWNAYRDCTPANEEEAKRIEAARRRLQPPES